MTERRTARSNTPTLSWRDVPTATVPLGGEPLDLLQTLLCGQAFRWSNTPASRSEDWAGDAWIGVANRRVWRLRRAGDHLLVQVVPELAPAEVEVFIRHYFWLDLQATTVQRTVADAHPLAAVAVEQFEGLRVLRQAPTEVFLTFSIASATNVPRITRSIAAICERFGDKIAVVDGVPYHAFPTPAALAAASTEELAGPCNLAYRARHMQAFARAVLVGARGQGPGVGDGKSSPPFSPLGRGDASPATFLADGVSPTPGPWPLAPTSAWLEHLAALPYREAHQALDAVPFCGPKLADCVCLFGLGFAEAVPVDVHVWAIAHELFGAAIPTRTLTPATYQRVGDLYRELFGRYAGWAQQYLYAARRATPLAQRRRPTS